MKYLVGLGVGGIMEDPVYRVEDVEIVEADTRKLAEARYNREHKCTYFYGRALASETEIFSKEVTVKQLESIGYRL